MALGLDIGLGLRRRPTVGSTPITYVLDALGLTAKLFYGLRKGRTAYAGACLRVRRVSDDAEQDIGFSGEALDWATAISFKGASSLVVVHWYDQSGSGIDFEPLATSRQPVLDTSAQLIDFDGVDDLLRATAVDLSGTDEITVMWAGKYDVLTSGSRAWTVGLVPPHVHLYTNGSLFILQQDASNNRIPTGDTTERVFTALLNRSEAGATDTRLFLNSTEESATSDTTNVTGNFASCDVSLAEAGGGSIADIKAREFVLFASALSDGDRAAAVSNIMAFYGL